jgi:antitoxin component of MazEF toxin-antitoxin module
MQVYQVKISKIGNSWGVRLPKEMVLSLGTTDVILERTSESTLIKPSPIVPPLSEWAEIFAKADTSPEPEFDEWDIALNDGED